MHNLVNCPDAYFEAIIQIRPMDPELINYVKLFLAQRKVSIAKEIFKKFGVDIYISSKKVVRTLERETRKRFPCSTNITTKLYSKSRITSKNIYRVTLLLRLKPKPL